MNRTGIFIFFLLFPFVLQAQVVDFTFQTPNGLFCSPTIVSFSQIASGSPRSYIWDFGNGVISQGPNPSVTYSRPGTYSVKLVVVYQNIAKTVIKPITINSPVSIIMHTDRSYICTPGDINFSALPASGISHYEWNFGDGTGAISTAVNTIAHNFSAKQDYNVTLKATNAEGCFDIASTIVTLKDPTVSGTISPTSGCIPATVRFTSAANIPANSTVTSYTWNFGEGNPASTTSVNNTTNVYGNTGSYLPSVMITTSEGCTSSFNYRSIAFGIPPTNQIGYPVKAVICGSETARFVSKATNANSYIWNFGDGTTAVVSDTLTTHKYTTLGTKTVTVTPSFNGCRGTSVTFTINVVGVIAGFNFANTCNMKETFSFTNSSQGNLSSVVWNFGDGSPRMQTVNVVHTFPSDGSFITSLLVIDSITGCRDSLSRTVYTARPKLVNPDSSLCRNSATTFIVNNNYNNGSATFTWSVNGKQSGPFQDSTLTDTATILGNFNNYVVISNGSRYCKDTIRLGHTMIIRGPELNFTTRSSLCVDTVLEINNTSRPYLPQDSIKLWYWNFGINNVNDTIYQPDTFAYPRAGKYNVKLSALDINGCFDSLVKPVTIHPLPFVQTIPTNDTLCTGIPDTLVGFHNGALTWAPATGLDCTTCDTVLANPSANTTYYATATSSYGCKYKDSVMIKVFSPFVASPPERNPYLCQTDTIVLKMNPTMKQIVWTPAEGLSNPNAYDPLAVPLVNTTYTATLTDSAGCFSSSADITVHVKSLPTVDAGPDASYPYNVPFSINPTYSNNIVSYEWTPSDLLSCTTCAFPNGVTTRTETYEIKVTSDSACVAKDSVTIFIECKDSYILMPNAFTPNDDGLNDYYYPITRGVKTIVRFSIYNRFGQLVYQAKNFVPNNKTSGWNGQLKVEDQSSSVFVYYLEALCDMGQTLYKKGSFVLLR